MDNTATTSEDPGYALGAAKLENQAKRSPMADALQVLEKALSGLEMNIDSLDVKLQPLQLRTEEAQRGAEIADRAPASDFTNAILEVANRVNRNAQRVRKINNDLEL